jgi:hypothetical protein
VSIYSTHTYTVRTHIQYAHTSQKCRTIGITWPTIPPSRSSVRGPAVSTSIYRVSIKYFPNYKHLLQENYVEYKRSTCWSVLMCCINNFLSWVTVWKKKYVCIPLSFLVIDICNQENTLCSPCRTGRAHLLQRLGCDIEDTAIEA